MNRFHCARCGKRLKYPDEHAGKAAHCPRCGLSFKLPAIDGGPEETEESPILEDIEFMPPIPGPARRAPSTADQRYLERTQRWILLNPASQVEVVGTREKFDNRLVFHRAKIAEGRFKDLSIVAFESRDPYDAQPFLIVITGSYSEHVRFENYPGDGLVLQRCFPGRTGEVIEAVGGYYNFSLPGNPLSSTQSFDDAVARLKPDAFEVREVLLAAE